MSRKQSTFYASAGVCVGVGGSYSVEIQIPRVQSLFVMPDCVATALLYAEVRGKHETFADFLLTFL